MDRGWYMLKATQHRTGGLNGGLVVESFLRSNARKPQTDPWIILGLAPNGHVRWLRLLSGLPLVSRAGGGLPLSISRGRTQR